MNKHDSQEDITNISTTEIEITEFIEETMEKVKIQKLENKIQLEQQKCLIVDPNIFDEMKTSEGLVIIKILTFFS